MGYSYPNCHQPREGSCTQGYQEPTATMTGTSDSAFDGGYCYSSCREFRVPDAWLFDHLPFGWQQEDLRKWLYVTDTRQDVKDMCYVDANDWVCGNASSDKGCANRWKNQCQYPKDPRRLDCPEEYQMPYTNDTHKLTLV